METSEIRSLGTSCTVQSCRRDSVSQATDKSRESYDRLFSIDVNAIAPVVVDGEHWGRVKANSQLQKGQPLGEKKLGRGLLCSSAEWQQRPVQLEWPFFWHLEMLITSLYRSAKSTMGTG